MSKRQSVMFGDWSKGDYGRLDPTTPGSFRGLDVMVYPDGAVGPRTPMRPFPVTGYGTARIDHAIWVGNATYSTQESVVTVDVGGVVRGFSVGDRSGDTPTGDGTTTSPGTVTSLGGLVEFNNQLFGVRFGSAGVRISSSSITSVAAMPSGQAAVAYGDQMVILRDTATGSLNELRWSAPADPTSWPAANFLKVGDGPAILVMRSSRNSLVFGLADGSWWVLTGPLGSSAVLRRVDKSLAISSLTPAATHTRAHPVTVTNGGTVMWADYGHLGAFTGAHALLETILDVPFHPRDFTNGYDAKTAAPLLGDKQLAVSSYTPANSDPTSASTVGTIIANPNDAWARWKVPETLASTAPVVALLGNGSGILFIMTQVLSPDAAPKFYTLSTLARSPLFSGGVASVTSTTVTPVTPTDGATGAVVQGTLRTHTWWHPEMNHVTVAGVVVDIVYEASHSAGGNVGFSVAVESVSSSTDLDHVASGIKTWVPNQPKLSSTGTNLNPYRAIFRFGEQGPGPGFRVVFTNLKGCMIRRVMAIVDVDDEVRL